MARRFIRSGTGWILLGTAIGAGSLLLARLWTKRGEAPREPGSGPAVSKDEGPIRNAGPEAMRTPPTRAWTAADEASDESFPASDPPGRGVG